MFGFKGNKKGPKICSICGKGIEPGARESATDICDSCFDRCVYLSKQLEYLQNTSIENLIYIQKASFNNAGMPEMSAGAYAADRKEESEPAVNDDKPRNSETYCIIRKATNEKFTVTRSLTIGSSEQKATVSIPENKTLSRVHAQLKINDEGKCCLIDMESRNGSKINGKRIEPNTEYVLEDGNVFSLASETFVFVVE